MITSDKRYWQEVLGEKKKCWSVGLRGCVFPVGCKMALKQVYVLT